MLAPGGMWGACRVSLKVLALACPEMKRNNPWWRCGLSSHPHLKATHGQGPQFTCLSNGETGPNGMEKRDFYRQSEGQVWPQISAATQGLLRPTPTCYLRPWGWGSRFGEGQFPLSCTCWFAHWEDVAAPRQPEDPVSRSTRTCWDPFCLLWSSPSSPFGLSLLHPRTLCLQPTLRTQLTWGAGTKHPGETPPQAGSRHARRAGRGHMTGTPAPRRLLPLPRRFPLRGGCRCRPPRPAPFRPGRPPWSLISRSQAARPCRESATVT